MLIKLLRYTFTDGASGVLARRPDPARFSRSRQTGTAVATGVAVIALAGCGGGGTASNDAATTWEPGSSTTPQELDDRPEITDFCPDEPMKLGYADADMNNAWKRIAAELIRTEAARCENITEVIVTDAGGSPEKYSADISGLIAKDVAAIVTFNQFGEGALPTIRQATRQGIPVVGYNVDMGGRPGVDYADVVLQDTTSLSDGWADWLADRLGGSGNVLFLGGPAGNPQTQAYFDDLSRALQENHPDITLLGGQPVATGWTMEGAQQATAGAISKHGDTVDAIVSDFLLGLPAMKRAYDAAGIKMPDVTGLAMSNETGCVVQDLMKANPDFDFMAYDRTVRTSLVALRRAVAYAAGKDNPETSLLSLTPAWTDTAADNPPPCEPSLPPEADLSSGLSTDQLAALLK